MYFFIYVVIVISLKYQAFAGSGSLVTIGDWLLKIYKLVQKLLSAGHTDRQTDKVKYFTKMCHYSELQNSTRSGSAFVPTESQNFASSPYFKASSNKFVGMFLSFYYTKLNWSKSNGSWVVNIKLNMNFVI
jgi:hypothetical protein